MRSQSTPESSARWRGMTGTPTPFLGLRPSSAQRTTVVRGVRGLGTRPKTRCALRCDRMDKTATETDVQPKRSRQAVAGVQW